MGLESVATGTALILQELVVEGEPADEHTDVGACQPVRGYPPVLQRLPCGLQQETLLRIEQVCLARGDTEELGVELVDLIEESASTGDHLAELSPGSGRSILRRSNVFQGLCGWRRFHCTASSSSFPAE